MGTESKFFANPEAAAMKSPGRIVLAVIAVVGLVAGMTFIMQYQVGIEEPQQQASPGQGRPDAKEVMLHFPDGTKKQWHPPSDGQFEQQTNGFYDFWFQNDNSVPVRMGLRSKSCKCTEVAVGVLPPGEAKQFRNAAGGKAGTPPTVDLKVQPLEVSEVEGIVVEPEAGGIVRLAWEDKKEKTSEDRTELLVVELWNQGVEGGPKAVHRLELPVMFVPALRLDRPIANLDDLGMKEEKTAEFKCWSSTRPQFNLTAKAQTPDPCISCSCTPLTEQAQKALADERGSRVLCGYTVQVTVHERLSDTVQMELGPFSRRILLTSDPGIEPTAVVVSGVVRGDVTVEGTEEDKGQISLGLFRAKDGITKRVRLTAQRPGMELKVDKVEGTHLLVKSLNKVPSGPVSGRTSWELCVEVPPGSPAGRLERTAVLLAIPGNPPRHLRIPVIGSATQ
jgi:hypothetical protein